MARITIDGKLCLFSTKQSILSYDYREVIVGSIKEIRIFATAKTFTHGYLEQAEAFRRYGENTKPGHKARVDCAPLPLFTRLPLP